MFLKENIGFSLFSLFSFRVHLASQTPPKRNPKASQSHQKCNPEKHTKLMTKNNDFWMDFGLQNGAQNRLAVKLRFENWLCFLKLFPRLLGDLIFDAFGTMLDAFLRRLARF